MSEPFIAEVRIFAGNFAPRGWAFCNGQLLQIAQNTALFSLLGTTYGGDGRTTFGLPNLEGKAPMHPGNGPGLTSRRLGQSAGEATHTLSEAEIPSHTHQLRCADDSADTGEPASGLLAASSPLADRQYRSGNPAGVMSAAALAIVGSGQPHNNMPPYLTLYFIIALVGLYPSRS